MLPNVILGNPKFPKIDRCLLRQHLLILTEPTIAHKYVGQRSTRLKTSALTTFIQNRMIRNRETTHEKYKEYVYRVTIKETDTFNVVLKRNY